MTKDFTALLENALQLTRRANLPPDLEPIAFKKAIDYLLGSNPQSHKELISTSTLTKAIVR